MRRARRVNWNFHGYSNATGKTTRESIQEEIKQSEKRLSELPVEIANYEKTISNMTSDRNWLSSLNSRRTKNWEEENGKSAKDAIYFWDNKIVEYNAIVKSKRDELAALPGKIETLKTQLQTLVEGESKGLTKGLDAKSAEKVAEIEYMKEMEKLDYERQQREEDQKKKEEEEAVKARNKKIIIGLIVIALIVAGVFIYKKYKVKIGS